MKLEKKIVHFSDIMMKNIYCFRAQQTSGIFLHNAAEQWIDTLEEQTQNTTSAYFMVEGAAFDLFVLFGPTPKDVVRQITHLTGRARIPQVSCVTLIF